MRRPSGPRFSFLTILLLLAGFSASALSAQAPAADPLTAFVPAVRADRLSAQPDFAPRVALPQGLPHWAETPNLAPRAFALDAPMRLSLVLARDPATEAAFERLLAAQQQPGSPAFHHWLIPAQIGTLFGPTDHDLAAVEQWVASTGLHVDSVSPSRVILEISGTRAAVASAFRTSFGFFRLNGEEHLAPSSPPSIPAVLAPVLAAVHGLLDLSLQPEGEGLHVVQGRAHVSAPDPSSAAPAAAPRLTLSNGSHYLTPNDFATVYDLGSVYGSGNTGATIAGRAQHIAVIGRSRVAATDISEYAANVGISSYTVNTVLASAVDPGTTGNQDQGQATFDVDRTIGTAPGAQTDLVISGSVGSSDGIYVAAAYNVNTLLDPVMNISFGNCEAFAGSAGVSLWDTLFASAAAEGISVLVESGDGGVAGCNSSTASSSAQIASINYICASSYATCVGGTEFADTANPSLYWSSSNGAGNGSALSYIPEGAWNEPATVSSSGQTTYAPLASGGGASAYIAKPSWQTGTGVPADGARDVPDVALSSSIHDAYYGCLAFAGADCAQNEFALFYGTGTAAPGMSGIVALLNTRLGSSQGNLNPMLYRLAATSGAHAFHDVTVATSGVSGCTASVPSMCNNSAPGYSSLTGGLPGFLVGTGYDQVTGLGSPDVAQFLAAAAVPLAPTLTLTASANPVSVNTPVIFQLTVASSNTGTATPTGTVQFSSNGTAIGGPVTLVNGVAATPAQTYTTPGNYTVQATYSGNGTYAAGTATITLVVAAAALLPTSVSLIASANPVAVNAPVTFTATVLSTSNVAATGTVQFLSNGTALGAPVTLSNGSATSPTQTYTTAGNYSIQAVYSGSAAYASSSASLTLVVTAVSTPTPTFTIVPATPTLSLAAGATTGNTDALTIASANGFAGTVNLACSVAFTGSGTPNLPPTCAIAPATAVLSASVTSAASTLTLASTAAQPGCTATSANRGPGGFPSRGVALLSAALLLLLPIGRRRRTLLRLLPLALLLAVASQALNGCGGDVIVPLNNKPCPVAEKLGTTPGVYTVTLTGSGNGQTATSTVALTIH